MVASFPSGRMMAYSSKKEDRKKGVWFLRVSGNTARKTVFPSSWNIMESSKRPSKYYLYFNFLAKKDHISYNRKVQIKNFLVAQNKTFSVTSKYDLSINFLSQKRPYLPTRKFQNKNFSVNSKYHLSIKFLSQKKTIFPIPEKFKTRTF